MDQPQDPQQAHELTSQVTYNPDNLLDSLIERLNLKNDAALSRALEVAPPVISKIRHRRLPVGASMLIRSGQAQTGKGITAAFGKQPPRAIFSGIAAGYVGQRTAGIDPNRHHGCIRRGYLPWHCIHADLKEMP
jgi:hypothetical protein